MTGFYPHFSLKISYKPFFYIHHLEPTIHLSFVCSNALEIAAITGNPKNSILLAVQLGANQKSSFA
jgi:hypothetical protein